MDASQIVHFDLDRFVVEVAHLYTHCIELFDQNIVPH